MTLFPFLGDAATGLAGETAAQHGAEGRTYVNADSLIKQRFQAQRLCLGVTRIKSQQLGQYYSPFKGRGMEFDESRLYQAGDDVRNLDWRVTARTGEAHTKLFREERERAVLVWVDFQSSMFFATRGAFKSVLAARAAAYVAWATLQQGDRLGYLVFNELSHLEQRPQGGQWNVLHFMKCLADASAGVKFGLGVPTSKSNAGPEAGFPALQALLRLRRVSRPGSKLILISDFRHLDQQMARHLSNLSRHNDVVLMFLHDPLEMELPPAGIYRFKQGERVVSLDTGQITSREQYASRFSAHAAKLEQICKRYSIHFLPCRTDADVLEVLGKGL